MSTILEGGLRRPARGLARVAVQHSVVLNPVICVLVRVPVGDSMGMRWASALPARRGPGTFSTHIGSGSRVMSIGGVAGRKRPGAGISIRVSGAGVSGVRSRGGRRPVLRVEAVRSRRRCGRRRGRAEGVVSRRRVEGRIAVHDSSCGASCTLFTVEDHASVSKRSVDVGRAVTLVCSRYERERRTVSLIRTCQGRAAKILQRGCLRRSRAAVDREKLRERAGQRSGSWCAWEDCW